MIFVFMNTQRRTSRTPALSTRNKAQRQPMMYQSRTCTCGECDACNFTSFLPHVPLLRVRPWAQAVQLVADVQAVQLAGQSTQAPLVATVLAGHEATVITSSVFGAMSVVGRVMQS